MTTSPTINPIDAAAELDALEGRKPLATNKHPISATVTLADGRLALIRRRSPLKALKGKLALVKLFGPTISRILVGGIKVTLPDGTEQRVEALRLISLASARGRAEAAAEGLDVEQLYTAARSSLPTLLIEALAELDPDGLDEVIRAYLEGAVAIQREQPDPKNPDETILAYVKLERAEQIDELLESDLDLGKLILEAVMLGLRPFVGASSSPPSS